MKLRLSRAHVAAIRLGRQRAFAAKIGLPIELLPAYRALKLKKYRAAEAADMIRADMTRRQQP